MILLALILNFALAKTPISSVRSASEDYKTILRGATLPSSPDEETALSISEDILNEPWNKLDAIDIDPITLQKAFENVRDFQPLKDGEERERRLTWLYPDDGCYARSAFAHHFIQTKTDLKFQQIFVFGNLAVSTDNHPSGQVTWWYHVVPLIKTTFGAFVFDPALEPNHPLEIDDWLTKILPNRTDGKVSLCNPSTYSPEHYCHWTAPIELDLAKRDETDVYLELEWNRLKSLGRDPEKELGPEPPWIKFPFLKLIK